MNEAEEDIRMSKHVLQIKVCCHLPKGNTNTYEEIRRETHAMQFFAKMKELTIKHLYLVRPVVCTCAIQKRNFFLKQHV